MAELQQRSDRMYVILVVAFVSIIPTSWSIACVIQQGKERHTEKSCRDFGVIERISLEDMSRFVCCRFEVFRLCKILLQLLGSGDAFQRDRILIAVNSRRRTDFGLYSYQLA